jgi:hypothetical protein
VTSRSRPLRARLLALGLTLFAVSGVALADGAPATSSGPQSWPVTTGVTIHVEPLAGATPMTDDALPVVDLSQVAGAKIVLRKGVSRVNTGPNAAQHPFDTLVAVCATAPSEHFSVELEPMVFSKLNDIVRADLSKGTTIDRFEEGQSTDQGGKTEETFSAQAHLDGLPPGDASTPKKRADGRHSLAFVDGGAEIVVCTVECAEMTADSARVCPAVVASSHLDGTFASPPSSSFFGRLGAAVLKKPLGGLGLLLGFALVLGGLVVAAFGGRRASGQTAS